MSKDDIEKLDKQIELLKKDKEGNPTGEVETVVTEIHDPNDENHVVNISYVGSEVKESTKELKDLKTLTTEVEEKVEDTKEIPVTEPLDAIVENEVEEMPAKVEENIDNNNSPKKSNNKLFIILGVVIGLLVLIFIICLFVFSGDDKKDDKPVDKDVEETEKSLSKEDMIKTIDLYGKTLEDEITKYYNQNNKLPDFSTVNNLVNLDYEVFHKLLILDYLSCHNIKPSIWWEEKISPKEKSDLLRKYHKEGIINYDLTTLYKYSLLIPLKNVVILAIYKNNTRKIHIINK